MKYRCTICGHIYDEDQEKVLFKDLPLDWVCPMCGAPKALFEPLEDDKTKESIKKVVKEDIKPIETIDDMVEYTPRELAIIMANLARGAEKQCNNELVESFKELEKYFNSIKSPVDNGKVEDLIKSLNDDLSIRFVKAKDAATIDSDRGALRALTWSTKVTTMLKSLVEKYQKEGNAMLDGKHIYVCSICGFVYVGEQAPELCPVCKVPSFKFEEVA